MKRILLFTAGAILAGSLFAQNELNGIKISEGNDPAQYHYYRIRNMRAMRFDYTNGVLKNLAGDSIARYDNGVYMSETLPDGTPTPKIADHPYMGLSNLAANWWPSFANGEEIQSPLTEYWYFAADKKGSPGSVKIKNAVISGSISMTDKYCTDLTGRHRAQIDYNSKNNFYYVLPVKPALEAASTETENLTDSILQYLTEEDLNMAFAFSQKDMISAEPGYANQCLSMNDYVSIRNRQPMLDEKGDTIVDAAGNPEFYKYGFAGVDLTGSPVTPDSKNHWGNNGSIFILEPVDATEVLIAKQKFDDSIRDQLNHHYHDLFLAPITYAVTTIGAWRNLPALFNESAMAKLTEKQEWLEKWQTEVERIIPSVSDYESRDALQNIINETVISKLNEAASLVGTGCIVRFQNQLSLQDLNDFVNGDKTASQELQFGNAYIAAGGTPTYKYDNAVRYMDKDDNLKRFANCGIEPRLEADANCEWELIPVKNTATFLLYNKANNCYIRKYHDIFEYAGGENAFGAKREYLSEFSWMTTPDKKDAAPFSIIGCPDEEGQSMPYDIELKLMEDAGLDLSIENKVRLEAAYDEPAANSGTGNDETVSYSYPLHRSSHDSEYKFIAWRNTFNNWFADSNAFRIESVEMGNISEIATDQSARSTGIYDLQGRRVANPGRGLYIVNGRKTFIK